MGYLKLLTERRNNLLRESAMDVAKIIGRAIAWIAIVAVGPTAAGQEVEKEEAVGGLAFVDEIQVTVVNIDVFVRDRDGKPVLGLSERDFRLRQDGTERRLSHFAAYTQQVISEIMAAREEEAMSGPAAGPAGVVTEEAEGPADLIQPVHIVLYVDNENLRPFDRNRVLSQVRRFVSEVMQPHVQVMVISVQRSPKIVQGFTDDPRAVKDALKSLTKVYGARTDWDRNRGRIIHDMQSMMESTPNQGARADQNEAINLEDRIRSYADEMALELNYSLNSLREVLTTLAGLPGRRVLVHISSGLPAVPARDLINWYGELYQRTSTLPMLARFNRRQVYNALASSANAQGVTFYTIDASGLAGASSVSAEHSRPVDPMITSIHVINYQEPLLVIAEKTGGRAIVDSNDITELLEEMRDDLFTYYSLGYTLSSTHHGREIARDPGPGQGGERPHAGSRGQPDGDRGHGRRAEAGVGQAVDPAGRGGGPDRVDRNAAGGWRVRGAGGAVCG
jgi:VWFA-related protein